MKNDKQGIFQHFPFNEIREGQKDVIEWAVKQFDENGKKVCIVEMPTGSGKSAVALTLAKHYGSAFWLTGSKMLQDQISGEFSENGTIEHSTTDLKGRNAYPCTIKLDKLIYTPRQISNWNLESHTCADGMCKKKGESRIMTCNCPYFNQVDKAKNAKIVTMNFSSFLCQTIHTDRFEPRKILIIDEGHNAEQELLSFISLSLSSKEIDIELPKYDNPTEYATWLEKNDIMAKLEIKAAMYKTNEDIKMFDYINDIIGKLDVFLQEMATEDANWVVEYTNDKFGSRILCKPIFISKFANQYLFSMADRILIMSATILDGDVIRESLGISKAESTAKRIGSTFPKENHKIKVCSLYKATGGQAQQHIWGPDMTTAIDKIAAKHKNQRGIIHTHSYAIADMLVMECDEETKYRFTYQKDFADRSAAIEAHKAKPGSILISPSMSEGVDLKGENGEFCIIAKMPFANFYDDKQLAARKELNENYYNLKTAMKLVQSLGRCIRNETDTCTSYITDSTFGWWYQNNQKMIPQWVKDSLDLKGKI